MVVKGSTCPTTAIRDHTVEPPGWVDSGTCGLMSQRRGSADDRDRGTPLCNRAYGSVPRRFDWVKLEQEHRGAEDRGRRNTGCDDDIKRFELGRYSRYLPIRPTGSHCP